MAQEELIQSLGWQSSTALNGDGNDRSSVVKVSGSCLSRC